MINGLSLWTIAQVESCIVWTRAWIHRLVQRVVQRQRNIIVMDDNYIGNDSNNTNGLQIDRYFLDIGSAYIISHSKQSNDQKQH
jgi:hypothetical protein